MMTKKNETRAIFIGCSILVAGLLLDVPLPIQIKPVRDAEARIGRPLTPVSYAGVARRTRRRTFRRTAVYVAALPATGCTTVTINGALLHQCGVTYYQPYNNQYVVVEVD